MQMNPFVKFRGLELFGVIERAKGKASAETTERTWNQYAVDAVYRFLPTRSCSSAPATTGRMARWPASPATSAPTAGRSAAAGSSRRTC